MTRDRREKKSAHHRFLGGFKITRPAAAAAGSKPSQTPALLLRADPSSSPNTIRVGQELEAPEKKKKSKHGLSIRFLGLGGGGSRHRGEEAADHPGGLDATVSVHDGNTMAPPQDGREHDQHDAHANAHHQRGLPPKGSGETGLPLDQAEADPWDKAYSDLRENEKALVEAFEKILTYESLATTRNELIPFNTPNRFNALTGRQRAEKMKEILKPVLSNADRREFWEELAVQTVEFIDKIKDGVSSAVEACTPAAAAWAGICLLLPLFINPIQEHLKMVEGLRHVMDRMNWYMSLTNVVLRQKWPADAGLQEHRSETRSQAVVLFTLLLKFEMECACRAYDKHPVVRFAKDMILSDDWGAKLTAIQTLEKEFRPSVQEYVSNTMVEYQRQTASGINTMVKSIDSIADLIEKLRGDITRAAEKTQNSEADKRMREAKLQIPKFGSTTYVSQRRFNPRRIKGTCEWFERHDLYTSWIKDNENKLLLVTAEPGCGKSVLARFLIEEGLRAHSPDALVLYFFFKDNPDQNDLAKALQAILHQAFESCPDAILAVVDKVQYMSSVTLSDCSVLWDLFEEVCPTLQQKKRKVFCVLDALDECQAQGRVQLTTFLEDHFAKSGSIRFLVTSRPYPSIVRRFRVKEFSANVVSLEGDRKEEKDMLQAEIDIVFNLKIDEFIEVNNITGQTAEDVRAKLREKGKGQKTYLWARLVFKLLEEQTAANPTDLLSKVDNLPTTVPETYEKLLPKHGDEDYDRVRTLVHMVFISTQSLSLPAAHTALFIRGRYSRDSLADLDLNDTFFGSWVKDKCGFFITEYDGSLYFIHQTAKDFLLAHSLTKSNAQPDKRGQPRGSQQQAAGRPPNNAHQWMSSIRSETEAHFVMSESCVASLNQALGISSGEEAAVDGWAVNEDLLSLRRQFVRQSDFFKYSAKWWLHHFAKAQVSALNMQIKGVDASSREEVERHNRLLKAGHALIASPSARSSLPDFEPAISSALAIVRDFATAQLPLGAEIAGLMDQCLAWCSRDFPRPSSRCSSIIYATTFNIPGVLDIALAESSSRWPETSGAEGCGHSFEIERFLGFFIAVARKANECARLIVEFEERLGVDVRPKFELFYLTARKLKGGCSEEILRLLSGHHEA